MWRESLQNDSPGDRHNVNVTDSFGTGRMRLLWDSTEIISCSVHMEIRMLLSPPLLLCALMNRLKKKGGPWWDLLWKETQKRILPSGDLIYFCL